jgi:hypothetical protein
MQPLQRDRLLDRPVVLRLSLAAEIAKPRTIRPLLEHASPLSDRQSDPWPVLDRLRKDLARLIEVIAGIQEAIDLPVVSSPLLDLVEVADISNQRVGGFFVGPVTHRRPFRLTVAGKTSP